ncbi:MAG: hypothetical protein PHQ91_12355 [Thermoanaerobaculaceae bacterium]|nr:hypothetical protein [Thermoanaerobaculaceae bacterium]
MADKNVTNGPPGGETKVISGEGNELLTRWQKFIKIAKDDYKTVEEEVIRGDRLYNRKEVSNNAVVETDMGKIVKNPPNHLKRRIKTNVDQIYARNPKVIAKSRVPVFVMIPDPTTGMVTQKDVSEERSVIIEEVLNHAMSESELKVEAKACIRDAHIRPEAWMELGYNFDEDNQVDAIYFRRRSIKDILLDPEAKIYEGIIRRCRFIALKWMLTTEEAKNLKLDISVLESCSSKDEKHETIKYEVFHMWDKERNLQGFCCVDGNQFPSEPQPWPWKIDGFPFEPLRYDESPDNRWGTAPIIEGEGIQQEMDDMRETMNRHIVNARPVNLYDTSLDQTKIEALAGRGKRGWVAVKGLAERPNAFIQKFNDDQLESQFFNHYDRNDQELTLILGSAPNDQLQVTGETATEAQQTARASANQTGSKIDITEDFLKRVIRKAKQIIEQTYTTARMTEISGMDGNKYWVRWQGNILKDVDVNLEIGSTEKDNSERRLQVALNMLATMGKVPGIDVTKLALDVLRKSDYRNVEQYLLQQQSMQPPPAQPQPGGVGGNNPNVKTGGLDQQTNPMV